VSPEKDLVVLLAGMARTIAVNVRDSRSQPFENGLVTWSSNDTAVVKVAPKGNCGPGATPGCYRTSVYTISSGTAKITATIDGISTIVTVEVPTVVAGASGISADFHVIAYGNNAYAPFIKVTETSGNSRADIIAVFFSMPGVVGPVKGGWLCSGSAALEAHGSNDLFQEVYGEYQMAFGGANATSDTAHATLYVRRQPGVAATLELTAVAVPGTLPTTYTGGRLVNVWNCFF
jgi:hypothetical protein